MPNRRKKKAVKEVTEQLSKVELKDAEVKKSVLPLVEIKSEWKMRGLSFFEGAQSWQQHTPTAEALRLFHSQVAALPDIKAENDSCVEFLDWLKKKTVSVKGKSQQLIKSVDRDVSVERWGLDSKQWKARVCDFSPSNFGPDDELYEKHHDVWEMLPRGCSMLEITGPNGAVQRYWISRANRKFTGNEDEGDFDSLLYRTNDKPATKALVTLKENGQVLHLAARYVSFGDKRLTLVVVGSKKVHMIHPWPGDSAKLAVDMKHAFDDVRYQLPHEMLASVGKIVTTELINFLATNRLAINCEYVTPTGQGPIDNQSVHGIKEPIAFGFSMCFNVLKAAPEFGCELCVDPILGLHTLSKFGFQTVRGVLVDAADIQTIKAQVVQLPDVEGSVIYYMDDLGVNRLEKVKSKGYVIVRAIREKAKGIFMGKDRVASQWRAALEVKYDESRLYLSSAPADPTAIEALQGLQGVRDGKNDWTFKGGEGKPAKALNVYREMLKKTLADKVTKYLEVVAKRINSIDHIPLAAEERAEYVEASKEFILWIFRKITEDKVDAEEIFDAFGTSWTAFFQEYKKRQQK